MPHRSFAPEVQLQHIHGKNKWAGKVAPATEHVDRSIRLARSKNCSTPSRLWIWRCPTLVFLASFWHNFNHSKSIDVIDNSRWPCWGAVWRCQGAWKQSYLGWGKGLWNCSGQVGSCSNPSLHEDHREPGEMFAVNARKSKLTFLQIINFVPNSCFLF